MRRRRVMHRCSDCFRERRHRHHRTSDQRAPSIERKSREGRDRSHASFGSVQRDAPELTAPQIQTAIAQVVTQNPNPMPFFLPAMASVLSILDADDRDNAALDEPLATGQNAAVIANIPTIDFTKYPFTFIAVL